MRRSWRLLGAWLALAVGGAAGVGGTALASLWLSTPLAALAGGGIAAVSGVAAGHASKWIDRQHTLRRELPNRIAIQDRTGRLPRVGDVTNPIVLGVHPAEARSDHPPETLAGVTPYIPRDIDGALREAIHRESLIVVVGESTAGKSRAAFEAIRAACPDHLLAAPLGRESLPAVVAQVSHLRRCILWLDDLERFMGPDDLNPAMIASLTTSTQAHTTIVATLTSEYERFTSRAEASLDDQGRAFWRASRDILRTAYIIPLGRLWSQQELSLAATFAEKDPRIALALEHAKTFGVAESLAAGPELLTDWRNAWAPGSHARGAAIVAAAVDCRRAGLKDPVPHDLLLELHHHYLLARGGPALRPESVDEAWAWALRPVHGASSLLIPAGLGDAGPTYLAFDYLIDQPEHAPVPTETWNILLVRTNRSQAWQVSSEAYWRARTAFHAAVNSGAVDDVGSRSSAMADRGDYALAIQLLKDEFDRSATHSSAADNRGLRHQIAVYLMLSGRVGEAETIFESLLLEAERTLPPDDEYLQVVRHNLASCMGRRGNLPGALARFRRILCDRERYLGPEAMNTLATRGAIAGIIAKMGNPSEALRQTRDILADEVRALGKDHTNTLETRRSLARYLALTGDVNSAIDALQALLPDLERALGAGHPEVLDTRWDLARYHRQRGNRPQAKRLFEEVLADRERMYGSDNEGTRQARHEFAEFLAQAD